MPYIVKNANSILDALAAPSLPQWDDAYTGASELRVRSVSARPTVEGQTDDKTYDVTVRYEPPSGGQIDPSIQTTRWSFGTTTQRVTVDLDGKQIGSRFFYKTTPSPAVESGLVDDDAETEAEVKIPTLEIEVTKPLYSPFLPTTVLSLCGRVNNATITIDGFQLAADYVLFNGASVERISPGDTGFRIAYSLSAGEIELPSNVSKRQAWDDQPYQANVIPIRYGAYGRYKPQKLLNGVLDNFSPEDWPTIVAGGKNQKNDCPIAGRKLIELVIFRAYKAASFVPLGLT